MFKIFNCSLIFLILFCFLSCNENKIKTEIIKKTTSFYSLYIEYPVCTGLSEELFNNEVTVLIKKIVSNLNKQSILVCERNNNNDYLLPNLKVSYELLENDKNYLSIRFSSTIDWNNDLSSSTYYDCINFSIQKNKNISFSDYVIKKYPDEEKLIRSLRQICKQKLYNEGEIYCKSIWNSEKDLSVFENFNILSQSIQIKFDNIGLETNMCGNPILTFTEKELEKQYLLISK